jgi:uncharacterized membrane protein YciS (DUF1049 family)
MIWVLAVFVLILALASQNELLLTFALLLLVGALGWAIRRWME